MYINNNKCNNSSKGNVVAIDMDETISLNPKTLIKFTNPETLRSLTLFFSPKIEKYRKLKKIIKNKTICIDSFIS